MFDVQEIRKQFPILKTEVHGKPLVYLDNAATTQKPQCVLDASRAYYEHFNANVHRGAHYLSQMATQYHEDARVKAASFIGASRPEEFLFTSGCTMGLNLVANILGFAGWLSSGDEIILSATEHHSNIVPWQMLAQRTGAVIRYIPLTEDEQWDMDVYSQYLSPRTKVVSLGHVSNALGVVNPVKEAIAMAKLNRSDTLCIVDGAQSITHMPINVKDMGCDFFAFSGHKLYAPTGTGGLWGRYELLDMLPPWMGGGEMIQEVTFEGTTYNKPPFKYEAGTPNIEGAIAMGEAMEFVNRIGFDAIATHEHELMQLTLAGLASIPKVRVLGKDCSRGAVISILVNGVHHYDLGTLLDQMGIAVRTGHHCCQPLMSVLGTTGTLRISFAVYNTKEEVYATLHALEKAISMLS